MSEQAERRVVETAALSADECIARLQAASVGRVAVVIGGGAPVIRPVNFTFDPSARTIAFRTGRGSKLFALLTAPTATFEIDGIDLKDHTGWSVIVTGPAEAVTSRGAIEHLERLGLDTWTPGEQQHWIQIHAFSVTGRRITSTLERATAEGE